MTQAFFQARSDMSVTNNAQGINYDAQMSEERLCDENCQINHLHIKPNSVNRTFRRIAKEGNRRFEKTIDNNFRSHVCDNNCNHSHQLTQLERNRMGRESGIKHFGSPNRIETGFGGKQFTYRPPKINPYPRNRRPRNRRMEQLPIHPEKPDNYEISERERKENPNKTDDEIYQMIHNNYVSNKMKRNSMNNQHNMEKVICDEYESMMTKIRKYDQFQRNNDYQAKSDEIKNEEAEKNRMERENNLDRVMYFGSNRPRPPKPNRSRISERYQNELSQKRIASIFEKEKEDDEKQIQLQDERTTMQEERSKARQEKFEKRENEKWNQFILHLQSMQSELQTNEQVMKDCKMRKQRHNGAQSKMKRNEILSNDEQNDVLDEKQLEEISTEFKQAQNEYNNIINELQLFDDRIINMQEATKPTLKHLQTMNKINKRLGDDKKVDNLDDIPINTDSLVWDDAMGGWFHKGMPQYQTKMNILKLAKMNRIKPRERNQIIFRNTDVEIKNTGEFNKLIDDLIDDIVDFKNAKNEPSIWNELANKDIVEYRSYVVDFNIYSEWKAYQQALQQQTNEQKNGNENARRLDEDYYNETGLILRILLNNDGPFMNNHALSWKNELRKEFDEYYRQSDKLLGKYAVLDFNDVQKTYTFWMYMPKQDFPFRPGIINEFKNFVVNSKTNLDIEMDDIVAVSRSNQKFPERVYYTIKGDVPKKMPEYYGSKRYFYSTPVLDTKILSLPQQCMSWIPQCEACMMLGHRQGMSCPHIRRTLMQAKKKIDNDIGLTISERQQQKKQLRVCCFGCHFCSDKWHIADDCKNDAYCINCGKNHPALKDFECEKLQEMGLEIFQYLEMYKLARSQHKKPPRRPERNERIQWSKPWQETHPILEALDLKEFKPLAEKFFEKQEIIISKKRNIAKLSKLRMKVLFTKDENEVENIYKLIDEINFLDNANNEKIDELMKMDKIEGISKKVRNDEIDELIMDMDNENAFKRANEDISENENENDNDKNPIDSDENESENENENENESSNDNDDSMNGNAGENDGISTFYRIDSDGDREM